MGCGGFAGSFDTGHRQYAYPRPRQCASENTSSVGSADTFPSRGRHRATASTQGEGNWDAAQVSGAFAFPSRSRRGRWHRQVTDEVSPDHLPSGKLLIKRWKPCKTVGNVRRAGFAGTPLKGEGMGVQRFRRQFRAGQRQYAYPWLRQCASKKSQRRSGVTTAALLLCNITNSYNKRQVN